MGNVWFIADEQYAPHKGCDTLGIAILIWVLQTFCINRTDFHAMPIHFDDSAVDGRMHGMVNFTNVIAVEAPGGLKHQELWLLSGTQAVDDWNNWVVAFRLVGVGRNAPWCFHRIVPWWGEYVQVKRRF